MSDGWIDANIGHADKGLIKQITAIGIIVSPFIGLTAWLEGASLAVALLSAITTPLVIILLIAWVAAGYSLSERIIESIVG